MHNSFGDVNRIILLITIWFLENQPQKNKSPFHAISAQLIQMTYQREVRLDKTLNGDIWGCGWITRQTVVNYTVQNSANVNGELCSTSRPCNVSYEVEKNYHSSSTKILQKDAYYKLRCCIEPYANYSLYNIHTCLSNVMALMIIVESYAGNNNINQLTMREIYLAIS